LSSPRQINGRVSPDFQFAGLDPLHEFADAIFNFPAVTRLLKLIQDCPRQLFSNLGVGFENKFLLLLGGLNQIVNGSVGLDADKNTNLFSVRERRMQFVEAADEKVTDETIKMLRVVPQQHAKSLVQALTVFVRDECAVGGHKLRVEFATEMWRRQSAFIFARATILRRGLRGEGEGGLRGREANTTSSEKISAGSAEGERLRRVWRC
jgi:hypothetical protein